VPTRPGHRNDQIVYPKLPFGDRTSNEIEAGLA
jgi:hypothetical protein